MPRASVSEEMRVSVGHVYVCFRSDRISICGGTNGLIWNVEAMLEVARLYTIVRKIPEVLSSLARVESSCLGKHARLYVPIYRYDTVNSREAQYYFIGPLRKCYQHMTLLATGVLYTRYDLPSRSSSTIAAGAFSMVQPG